MLTENIDSLASAQRIAPGVERVKGNDLSDEAVVALARIPTLKVLDLSGCEQITDSSVSQLQELTCLESLDLSFCNQITDASLVRLAALKNLRKLNLNWC